MNEFMKAAIKELDSYKSPKKYINIEINNLFKEIWPNFNEINGCIINNKNCIKNEINLNRIIELFGSVEGYEDYEGHVHVVDIFDCSIKQSLKFGLILKEIWKKRIEMLFSKYCFKIVLWYDGRDKLNTILRFHRIRENGIELYSINEIDDYKKGGILVETIGKEEFDVGDEVELISFNGKNKPENPDEIERNENFYILIGSLGIVEKINERVLVKFKQNLDELGLVNHNEIKNTLWISKNDIVKK